ncbi:MAG: MerR family transcriptional regulator [Gammaproteobacteria bacterium]
MYQIKAVSSITGLTAETLRAWERRYGVVSPQRDGKGRRIYSENDIERLTLLNKASHLGHAISKIAGLRNEQLRALVKENREFSGLDKNRLVVQVVDTLMKYEFDSCENLLRQALVAMDPLAYTRDLLMPTLKKIGDLWHIEKLSVAQEHLFSHCVKRIVLSMIHNLMPFSGSEAKLIFATPSGESHEFGILSACLIAAHQRCTCYYLGSDVPSDDLIKIQSKLQADVIVLGLVIDPPDADMLQQMTTLAESISGRTSLWVGGSGAHRLIDYPSLAGRFRVIADLDAFNSILHMLNAEIRTHHV